MTNQEKFIEVMNDVFDAGLTMENMRKCCSPCGGLKKFEYACKDFSCNGCKRWWDKEYHRIEPSSSPLTLDELREMEGEPVWCDLSLCKPVPHVSQWAIVRENESEVLLANGGFLPFVFYGRTWLAYRRQPEEVPHET